MREYSTGATRSNIEDKVQYEGHLSPIVLHHYCSYMHEHRIQEDGKLRDADNWQQGIPLNDYMDSMWRHFMDVWHIHRGLRPIYSRTLQEALCALMFNVMGYLYETLVRPNSEEPNGAE